MATRTDLFDNLLSVIINNLGLPVAVPCQSCDNVTRIYDTVIQCFWIHVNDDGCFETGFHSGGFLEYQILAF